MRLTIIKDDGIVGIGGVFRKVDMSGFPAGIRAVQWDGENGHVEYEDSGIPNLELTTIDGYQEFIDLWDAAAPVVVPPTPAEQKAAAHARINAAYEVAVNALTAGYPKTEIDSWAKQETEARAWMADNSTSTPWIDSAAGARGIEKSAFVSLVIANADALAPLHGALTGKRQNLRDAINALGENPTQERLDAIQW